MSHDYHQKESIFALLLSYYLQLLPFCLNLSHSIPPKPCFVEPYNTLSSPLPSSCFRHPYKSISLHHKTAYKHNRVFTTKFFPSKPKHIYKHTTCNIDNNKNKNYNVVKSPKDRYTKNIYITVNKHVCLKKNMCVAGRTVKVKTCCEALTFDKVGREKGLK